MFKNAIHDTYLFYRPIWDEIIWAVFTFIASFLATYLDIFHIGRTLGPKYSVYLPFIYILIVLILSCPIVFILNLVKAEIIKGKKEGIFIETIPTIGLQDERLSITITNNNDKDFTDLIVELERLTIFGYPVDCLVRNKRPFFSIGIGNDGNKIRARKSASIDIAQIPSGNENRFVTEFLIDEGWRNNWVRNDLDFATEEIKKRMGEWCGNIYEFVIEITGKIDGKYISPQLYRGRILYSALVYLDKQKIEPDLRWIELGKYSMKEHKKREEQKKKSPVSQEVFTRYDFFKALGMAVQPAKKARPPSRNRKTSK